MQSMALLWGAMAWNEPRETDFRVKSCDRKDQRDPAWEQDEANISIHPFFSGCRCSAGFNSTLRWGNSSKERHKIDPGARKPDKRFMLRGMSDGLQHVGEFSVAHPKAQCLEVKFRQTQP